MKLYTHDGQNGYNTSKKIEIQRRRTAILSTIHPMNSAENRTLTRCRQLATQTITHIVHNIFAQNPTWQESLRYTDFIDIDITHHDVIVSDTFDNKVQIIQGLYVLDTGLFEPIYIQGAPKLLPAILAQLTGEYTADIHRESDRRILRISVHL
jgi:hypothetical protein